ncbi:MAG: aminotransferase class V-fold PLP-dependent enzyme [Myxococcota bacterium]|nr:aminotransferase class V-fold PLP-dependent enzyme [Myxococcota bacterium]
MSIKNISLTPAVFHLPERVNAVAPEYAQNPIVPRGPRLAPVLGRVQSKIRSALDCEETHDPVMLTCSGSGAIAAGLGSCILSRDASRVPRILVVSNGAYGERQARYAEQMGLATTHYALDYGERPDLEEIERLATQNDVDAIGLVHGATSTCSLNPMIEIGALARKFGKTYLVDGIASLFVEEIDLEEAGVHVMIGSTNKGLHSNPDLAFVLVAKPLLEEVCNQVGRIPYLDIGEAWKAQRAGGHPYTINIRALLEVEAALDALEDEGGVSGRVHIYQSRNRLLREGYEAMGLEIFKRPGMPLQNIGTALYLPEGVQYSILADKLAQWDDGSGECYEIYSAQGRLADEVFRIFNMGNYDIETYGRFLRALESCLKN